VDGLSNWHGGRLGADFAVNAQPNAVEQVKATDGGRNGVDHRASPPAFRQGVGMTRKWAPVYWWAFRGNFPRRLTWWPTASPFAAHLWAAAATWSK
jgi:hypothetical protein